MPAKQSGNAMGRPCARTVAIRDQILAVLRAEWPLPISTRRVCELLGANRYDETGRRVYPQLCALGRMGLVERIRLGAECRDVFWRFGGDPSDADLNAAVDALEPGTPNSDGARSERLQVDDTDPSCQIALDQRVWFVEGAEPEDDKLLLVDHGTGQQVVINHETWNSLIAAVAYFQQMHCDDCPDVTLAVPKDFVLVPGEDGD